jgi:hypothetical protein
MKPNELIREFTSQGELRGGELLLPLASVRALLARCDQMAIAMIGLEGFIVESGSTRPLVDLIADCSPVRVSSWKEYLDSANRCSREFLAGVEDSPRLRFAVTLLSESDRSDR